MSEPVAGLLPVDPPPDPPDPLEPPPPPPVCALLWEAWKIIASASAVRPMSSLFIAVLLWRDGWFRRVRASPASRVPTIAARYATEKT
jgi:hypothetical protein